MADVSILSRLLDGVIRNVALSSNTLVVGNLKIGGATNYATFVLTAVSGEKTITMPNANVDLGEISTALSTANAALPSASFTDAAVTGKLITGFSTSAGVVAATDTVLVALNKIDANANAAASAASGAQSTANAALPSASFTDSAVTGKLITGYSSGAGTIAGTDTILQALNKLNGNIDAAKVGAIIYKSVFDASAGNYSAISNPKQGWMYKVSVSGTIPAVKAAYNGSINVEGGGTDTLTVEANVAGLAGNKSIVGNGSDSCTVLIGAGYTISAGGAVILKSGDTVLISGGNNAGEYAVNDNMYINKDIVGTPTTADIDKIDNTESADLLRKGDLAEGKIFVGSASNEAAAVSMSSEASMVASGAVTLANSAVIAKVLTAYNQGAGTITSSDSILSGIEKAAGNAAAAQSTANAALPSASFTDASVTGKLITGFSAGAGAVAATDTILEALNKIVGNISAVNASEVMKPMISGQSFSANTTYAVRMCISGETDTRVYAADNDAATSDKFYAIGYIRPASSVSAGDSVSVYLVGEIVSSTAFTSSQDEGKPVFLGSSGAVTLTPPSAASSAVYRAGMVSKCGAAGTAKILIAGLQLLGINAA
jgi:hypothetical protein